MVGLPLFPFGLMRGTAKHLARRIKTRARLHHPLLLEPTPDHLLQDDQKIEGKEVDVKGPDPILQSIQLHSEVNGETPPNIPQTVTIDRTQDHYEPLKAGKIICNFYDPEENVLKPPESKYRHSSEPDDVSQKPHDTANPFQMRHFHHKGDLYTLISKHLQKHTKSFLHGPSSNSGNLPYNHHNDGAQVYGPNNNLPQSSTQYPNGQKITINQNFQISQIDGSNNGVSQSQSSNRHTSNIHNDLTFQSQDNQNYQGSQINGSYNAISQSQASHNNHLDLMKNDNINNFFDNQNDQISHISGSNNAVTQSQESNQHHSPGLPDNNYFATHDQQYMPNDNFNSNQNDQISHISGSNSAVTQFQQSNLHHSSGLPDNNFENRDQRYIPIDNFNSNQNDQISHISGSNNAVTQSQQSNQHRSFALPDNNFFSAHDQRYMPNDNFNSNQNNQISHISGSNNAITQSQQSNQHHSSILPDNYFANNDHRYHPYPNMPDDKFLQIDGNENFQASNINGNNNMIMQEQSSNPNPFDRSVVRAPYLIKFENERPTYPPERSTEQFYSIKRRKRQIKIWNLITDPNSQLDVTRTIENVGHAARNAMDDEKHPSFHIRNAVGSAKNAIMSGIKIIPQSFIIPSDYKIVGKNDEPITQQPNMNDNQMNRLQEINPKLLDNIRNSKMKTSPKFLHGKFDDVPSEEQFAQTYAKVGSMVRDSVRSSKETLNHIGNLYSNTRKAVAMARHSAPKMLMRSMRIPEVRRNVQRKPLEKVGSQNEFQDDFVGASEMMSSFGFLTPKTQKVNCKRNVITNNNFDANRKVSEQKPDKYVVETLQVLNDAKNVIGAKSLNEFLLETEKKYHLVYDNKIRERNSNHQPSAEIQQQSLDTRNTFDVLRSLATSNDDVLGSTLQDNTYNSTNDPITEKLFELHEKPHDYDSSENLWNENEHNEKSRISMTIGEKLVTPFMGKLKHEKLEPYYDSYKNDVEFKKK